MSCSLVILLAFLGSVQGSNMELPKLASLIQTHMGSNGTQHSAWKAQAQTFLGLLESMGKVVPQEKASDTRALVDQLITLLTGASGGLKTKAESDKATKESDMTGYIGNVNEYDEKARTAKDSANTKNNKLTTCLADMRALKAKHTTGCIDGGFPASPWSIPEPGTCKDMEATKKFTFAASSKFTWKCNFTAGETDTSCSSDESAIKKDLVEKNKILKTKYVEWQEFKEDCESTTTQEKGKCDVQDKKLTDLTNLCDTLFKDTSTLLCGFTTDVHTREEFRVQMETSMSTAPTLLDEQKVEFLDLSLIICVLRRFSDNLTFKDDDYSVCQDQTQGNAFVDNPTVPARPSTLPTENPPIQFGDGLADKYMGQAAAASGSKITLDLNVAPKHAKPKLYFKLASAEKRLVCDANAFIE